ARRRGVAPIRAAAPADAPPPAGPGVRPSGVVVGPNDPPARRFGSTVARPGAGPAHRRGPAIPPLGPVHRPAPAVARPGPAVAGRGSGAARPGVARVVRGPGGMTAPAAVPPGGGRRLAAGAVHSTRAARAKGTRAVGRARGATTAPVPLRPDGELPAAGAHHPGDGGRPTVTPAAATTATPAAAMTATPATAVTAPATVARE